MKSIKKCAAAFVVMAAAIGMMGCKHEPKHVHTFSTDWTTDSESHWHESTCGHDVRDSENSHEWNTETKTPTCVAKGSKTYTCSVCGNERTEDFDAFGWCETAIDAETLMAATSSSTYVFFGVFPKTIKKSSITVDETEKVIMGANTYYKGSDGEWYAKVTANPYKTDYTYSNAKTIRKGNTDYFKVEPIKWKVLTTDYNGTKKALLLAEEILTANVQYYVNTDDRTINSKTVYPNNYIYSTLRAYLNGKYESDDTQTATYSNAGFLQTAFTSDAQTLIADTTVVNDGASTSDSAGSIQKADGTAIQFTAVEGKDAVYYPDFTCDNTIDKIFLLSEQEVTTTAYGFAAFDESGTGSTRIRFTTDYALANYAYQDSTSDYGCYWHLRSPSYRSSSKVYCITYTGYALCTGENTDMHVGVVPALTISFK